MDDEEEIDIMNYDDISKISSGQLLTCDYTVHPNWVNENAEGGNFWSDSVPKHEILENNVEVLHSEEVVIEEPEVKPAILDLEWGGEAAADKEYVVFDDDIPAFVEEIIINDGEQSGDEDECDKDIKSPTCVANKDNDEIHWDEPAAFETHPAPENIKYIGPTSSRSLLKFKLESSPCAPKNPRSLLKTNFIENKPKAKFKQTLTVNSNIFEKRTIPPKKQPENKKPKLKFQQTVKLKRNNVINNNFNIKAKTTKSKFLKLNFPEPRSQVSPKKHGGKGKGKNRSTSNHGENITISHENEIFNRRETEMKISPHTIVKLNNCEELSDVEVDIEGEIEDEFKLHFTKSTLKMSTQLSSRSDEKSSSSSTEDEAVQKKRHKSKLRMSDTSAVRKPKFEVTEELISQLQNLEIPKKELEMNINIITDLEKYIHCEYFEGRLTKTPEQYLRIRNHILNMWKSSGKNVYISKTAVRNGLKHGGDVNCISRIHRLLEQIGAVNFGFSGTHFEYVRPLEEYMSMFVQVGKTNSNLTEANTTAVLESISVNSPMERRNRTRPNNFIFGGGEEISDNNYTIEHLDGVFRPDVPALNLNELYKVRRTQHINTELDLVKCLKFSKDNLAPFKVSITLSTILCIQLHSLSSINEKMGFLGGHRSKSVGRTRISLTKYKPCRTSEQSGTMCEMCPISQLEQSSKLKEEGFELLGWFHSHPLFPPNPSHTDVQTQKEMQLQFAKERDRPFVGVIFSCLSMTSKCVFVLPKDNDKDFDMNSECLPYELDVDIIKDCTNFSDDIKEVSREILYDEEITNIDEIVEKFKLSCESLLEHFGYNNATFFDGVL